MDVKHSQSAADADEQAGSTGEDDTGRTGEERDGSTAASESDDDLDEDDRREYNNKLRRKNRKLKSILDEREAELERLRAKLGEDDDGVEDTRDRGKDRRKSDRKRGMDRNEKRLAQLEAENEDLRRNLFESKFSAAVLRGVPESKKGLAEDVLAGLMARGAIDIDPNDDEMDVRTVVRETQQLIKRKHPMIWRDSGPPPSGANAPDATAAIRNARSPSEIKGEDWQNVSHEQLAQWFGGAKKSGSLGM